MRLDGSVLVAALLVAQLTGSASVLATWPEPAAPARSALVVADSSGALADRAEALHRRRPAEPVPGAAVPAPTPSSVAPTVPPAAAASAAPAAPRPAPASVPAAPRSTASRPAQAAPAPAAPAPAAAAPAPTPPPAAADPAAASGSEAADYNARLVAGVNAERRSRGLPALRGDACAQRYAREHAERMAAQARMHHQDLAPVLAGCGANRVSENVGYGDISPERMVQLWMASDSHRATILDPRLTAIGSGAARRDDGRWYACHVFLG